jgi:hypothetical protein
MFLQNHQMHLLPRRPSVPDTNQPSGRMPTMILDENEEEQNSETHMWIVNPRQPTWSVDADFLKRWGVEIACGGDENQLSSTLQAHVNMDTIGYLTGTCQHGYDWLPYRHMSTWIWLVTLQAHVNMDMIGYLTGTCQHGYDWLPYRHMSTWIWLVTLQAHVNMDTIGSLLFHILWYWIFHCHIFIIMFGLEKV